MVFLLTFLSCGKESKVQMSQKERSIADSIYLKKRVEIDSLVDSLCSQRYDSIYKEMYDSILEERLKTIRKLYPNGDKK